MSYRNRYFERGRSADQPLLLYLHGVGEREGVPRKQLVKHGPWTETAPPKGHPRLAAFPRVAPHLPRGDWKPNLLNDFVLRARQDFGITSRRLLVVGASLGGKAALELAATYGRELGVIGVVAFCPASIAKLDDALTVASVYVFHGDGDIVVPLQAKAYDSRAARSNFRWVCVDRRWTWSAAREQKGEEQRHHNCWSPVFRHPSLCTWLTNISRSARYRRRKGDWPDFSDLAAQRGSRA